MRPPVAHPRARNERSLAQALRYRLRNIRRPRRGGRSLGPEPEDSAMTNTAMMWIVVALFAAAAVLVAAIAFRRRARVRSAGLRRRFGPEYDRAVQEFGSRMRAEHELAARARRIDHIQFRELNLADRARFASTWSGIQAQFVDDPPGAVMGA